MTEVAVLLVNDEGDAHGDAVVAALRSQGVHSLRYNLGDLRATPIRVEGGALDLRVSGGWQRVTSATTVWWRRAGAADVTGLDREEARLALDEGPHILQGALMSVALRWIDDPFDVERAELKLYQLGVAASLGVAIPATCVTNDRAAAMNFSGGRSLLAKALSPGTGIAPFVDTVTASDLDRVTALATLLQEQVAATADCA